MDSFQIKAGTGLSGEKCICKEMCTLYIHVVPNLLIAFYIQQLHVLKYGTFFISWVKTSMPERLRLLLTWLRTSISFPKFPHTFPTFFPFHQHVSLRNGGMMWSLFSPLFIQKINIQKLFKPVSHKVRNIEKQHFLLEPKIAIHIPLHLLQMAVREAYVGWKKGKPRAFLVSSYH